MSTTPSRPADLQKAIDQAVAAFNAGNLELADSLCRKMTRQFADQSDAFTTFGHFLMSTNRMNDAIPIFQRALEKTPSRHDLHVQLAHACTRSGQYDLASQVLEEAEKKFPDNAEITNATGNLLAKQGKHAEAADLFRQAISTLPDWVTPRENLCSMLYELRKYDAAETEANELLSIDSDNAVACNTLGIVKLEQEKTDEAISLLQKAIQLRPRDVTIIHNLGLAYSNSGELDKAREMYSHALEIQPTRVDVLLQLLHITKLTKTAPEWKLLENVARHYDLFPGKAKYQFHFSYGKAYADIGEHDEAFEHYAKANEIKHKLVNSNINEAKDRFENVKQIFTSDFLQRVIPCASSSEKPVFIVGMPRSGSTLVEQIISSHPAANGGGEMTEFPELVGATTATTGNAFAEYLRSRSAEQFTEILTTYLAAVEAIDPQAERVCDKQLANFVLLPLMATMFPNATIVHCLRDPRDTCVSCYFNDFARSHFYTTDLAELGQFYNMYRSLMDNWENSFDLRIHSIQYESLVENPEEESRRLIEAIGLPWNNACLSPHQNRKGVRTASVAQVREPIYRSSIGRWRNYAGHLEPLIATLGSYDTSDKTPG